MEPFLEYMAGGPCYECGGKTKYFTGGESPKPSTEAPQRQKPGADEQAKQLMKFLTEQISKGASPNVLKRTLVNSGVKEQDAEQLIGMASQMFEQNFQQGVEPKRQEMQQQMPQPDLMSQNPFEEAPQQEMRRGGQLKKFLVGGFDNEVKLNNPSGTYTVKEIDPAYTQQLQDPNNYTVTNKNQVSNIADTKFNRGLAKMSGLSNPNSAIANMPDAGGFGAGLKFLAGAAGFLGSAGLGIKKFTADDRTRMYDKTGNILTDSQNPDKYKKTIDKTYTSSPTASSLLLGNNPALANGNSQIPGISSNYSASVASNNPTMDVNIGYAKSKEEPMAKMPIIKMIPEEVKEEGGEWNPFVDNRRRLKFTMPLYDGGGAVMTYEQWLAANNLGQGMTAGDDFKAEYQQYVDAAKKQQTNPQTTTIQRGDPLGKVVANNALNSMQMMANATDYFANQKKEDAMKRNMIMQGNTMQAAPVVNSVNPYGSMYTLNAGPGANQNVAQLGYSFNSGTTMASAKYGGMTQYKKGGVYEVSPEELQRIIDMGGEVEFLD